MTITGLELRRATWEALGHTFTSVKAETDDRLWCQRIDESGWSRESAPSIDELLAKVPPIESDNGIALDELVKFCDEREWYWELRVCRPNQVCCILGEDDEGDGMTDICEYGETPAEAICRALIQAASVKA